MHPRLFGNGIPNFAAPLSFPNFYFRSQPLADSFSPGWKCRPGSSLHSGFAFIHGKTSPPRRHTRPFYLKKVCGPDGPPASLRVNPYMAAVVGDLLNRHHFHLKKVRVIQMDYPRGLRVNP